MEDVGQQPDGEVRTCRDCAQTWIYTVREQEFMIAKGFRDPLRCASCRQQRRHSRRMAEGDGIAGPFE